MVERTDNPVVNQISGFNKNLKTELSVICSKAKKTKLDLTLVEEASIRLENVFDKFSRELYYIVVFGPERSGKSTLVNTLMRQYSSPTKYQLPCTQRPILIMKGRKKKKAYIEEYYTTDTKVDLEEAFDLIIESLLGLIEASELPEHYIDIETYPLSEQWIDNRFTESTPGSEPILTVIYTPNTNLAENIAIIEVPGGRCDRDTDVIYKQLAKRTNCLLFLQNSFIPLHRDNQCSLQRMVFENCSPDLILVHNVVDTPYSQFHSKEVITNQKLEGKKHISHVLGLLRNDEITDYTINVGMAEQALQNIPENIEGLADSKLLNLEKDLNQAFMMKWRNIHYKKCIDGVNSTFYDIENLLSEFNQSLKEMFKESAKKYEQMSSCVNLVQSINYYDEEIYTNMIRNITKLINNTITTVVEAKRQIEHKFQEKHSLTIEELNNLLKEFCMETAATLGGHFSKDNFGEEINNRVLKSISRCEDDILAQINKIFAEIGLASIEPCFSVKKWSEPIQDGLFSTPEIHAEDNPNKIFNIWRTRKYRKKSVQANLNEVSCRLDSDIDRYREEVIQSFEEYYSTLVELRKREFVTMVQKIERDLGNELEQQDRMISGIEEAIKSFLSDIDICRDKVQEMGRKLVR